MIFEGTQYSVKLKIKSPEYETITHVQSITIYSSIVRPYPLFKINLRVPPRVYRDIIRFSVSDIFIVIDEFMETNNSEKPKPIKTYKFDLLMLTYSYVFPVRDEYETNNIITPVHTPIEIICVPMKAMKLASEMIRADVYKKSTLQDILKKISPNININPEFDNKKQFDEIFIPTLSVQNIISYLEYYYGFYKGQYVLYINVDNEDSSVLDFNNVKMYISKINHLKKEKADVITIFYANDKLSDNYVMNNIDQRTVDNKIYYAVGALPINMANVSNTIKDGFVQRYVFKPLDLLHDTRYNILSTNKGEVPIFGSKNETGQYSSTIDPSMNIDKGKPYVLSKSNKLIEKFKIASVLYNQAYKNYPYHTSYDFLESDEFNEMFISKNDAIISNENLSIYLSLYKGLTISHFLTPGRTIIMKSSPKNVQLMGTYYLNTAIMEIFKNEKASYNAKVDLKLCRANVNHDEERI